jgi:hypothetical protein
VFALRQDFRAEDAKAVRASLITSNWLWINVAGCSLALAASALWEVFTHRITVSFWLSVALAANFGVSNFLDRLCTRYIYSVFRRTIVVLIDEQNVTVEWLNSKEVITSKQRIPWTSLSTYGTAAEFSDHLMLRSGRGLAWIAKRAFSSAEEMAAFRKFVADKMGTHSQISTMSEGGKQV